MLDNHPETLDEDSRLRPVNEHNSGECVSANQTSTGSNRTPVKLAGATPTTV